uniref:Uncharacterized protein n=1 Tax=viral metagenome TaxID=1070528 RepID=A0A6M3L8B4_9ZZZZ
MTTQEFRALTKEEVDAINQRLLPLTFWAEKEGRPEAVAALAYISAVLNRGGLEE